MYPIPTYVDPRLRMNPTLAAYARLEYGNEQIGWLLAAARTAARRNARPSLRPRFLRARASHRPVACKGTPRLDSSEAASPG